MNNSSPVSFIHQFYVRIYAEKEKKKREREKHKSCARARIALLINQNDWAATSYTCVCSCDDSLSRENRARTHFSSSANQICQGFFLFGNTRAHTRARVKQSFVSDEPMTRHNDGGASPNCAAPRDYEITCAFSADENNRKRASPLVRGSPGVSLRHSAELRWLFVPTRT